MAKVLLVDDSIYIVKSFEIITRRGHQLLVAGDGLEGLKRLVENPDIIFSDYNMPSMDGYEFSKALRTDPRYAQYAKIPLVGIGSFDPTQIEFLDRTMEKPFSPEELFKCIDEYCSKK